MIRLVRDVHEAFYVWNEIDQHQSGFKKRNFKTDERNLTDKIKASQTALLAGKNKGLTSDKVMVEIISPDVVNLTVVDLPGLGMAGKI